MLNSMEHFRRANALGADTSLAIATLSFDGFERLFSRQFGFAKAVLDTQLHAVTAQAGGTPDIDKVARGCQSQLQEVLDLSRDCMQIGFTLQGDISRCVREAMDSLAAVGELAPARVAAVQAAVAEEDAPAKPRRR